jgi:choline dehydrogenase-like flavoprotein
LIEAGRDNMDLENTHMVGGWSQNFDTEHDWILISEPNAAAANRVVKLSQGKFLGGSSAVKGTLMVRVARQDYDDVNVTKCYVSTSTSFFVSIVL